jgi:predicted SAM-dependent methyltransferase
MTGPVTRLKRTESPVLRDVLLRTRGSIHYLARGHVVRRLIVTRYLASTSEPCLQIGSGPLTRSGWLNSDLIAGDIHLDLNGRLPLSSESFSYVFGEHVIEHLSERSALALLVEIHRILKPEGVLRLVTPDLRKLIGIYEDRSPVVSRVEYARYLDEITGKRHDQPCSILNDSMRLWGHRYVYDEDDLGARLLEAGFERIERHEPGESLHAALRGLEGHGNVEWVNRAEAMCLEAVRPREVP